MQICLCTNMQYGKIWERFAEILALQEGIFSFSWKFNKIWRKYCSIFSFLRNDKGMETVEFLANIVSHVKDVNIKLQGEKHAAFDLRDFWTWFFHNRHRTQRCVSVELLMKMFLLDLVFEWRIVVWLQNVDYFEDVLLCDCLYTKVASNPCFFENHLGISKAQTSLLLDHG